MKKDKGVAIASPSMEGYTQDDDEEIFMGNSNSSTRLPATRFSTRNASSKYDFVKVPYYMISPNPFFFWLSFPNSV